MKKKIVIEWDEHLCINLSTPDTPTKTAELVGVLEMCKLIVFENKTKENRYELQGQISGRKS